MKKISALLSFLILFTAFTCDDEPLDGDFTEEPTISCADAIQNVANATANFSEVTTDDENYSQLCIAYKNALQGQIDACGDEDGLLQTIITSLDNCGLSDCEIAIIETGSAETAYNSNNTNSNLCNAYKAALQNQITTCGDVNGSIQAIIDGLDCTSGNENPSGFAMTFKINGVQYNVNNPWGNNTADPDFTLFTFYPPEEYILLQGRNGLLGLIEIDLWIKREHLIANSTYEVGELTDGENTHIDLINNSNDIAEETISGYINISTVNTTTKYVEGTFEFNTTDYDTTEVTHFITEGTFNYYYDVEQ